MKTSKRKHATNINKHKKMNFFLDLALLIIVCTMFCVAVVSQI